VAAKIRRTYFFNHYNFHDPRTTVRHLLNVLVNTFGRGNVRGERSAGIARKGMSDIRKSETDVWYAEFTTRRLLYNFHPSTGLSRRADNFTEAARPTTSCNAPCSQHTNWTQFHCSQQVDRCQTSISCWRRLTINCLREYWTIRITHCTSYFQHNLQHHRTITSDAAPMTDYCMNTKHT